MGNGKSGKPSRGEDERWGDAVEDRDGKLGATVIDSQDTEEQHPQQHDRRENNKPGDGQFSQTTQDMAEEARSISERQKKPPQRTAEEEQARFQ